MTEFLHDGPESGSPLILAHGAGAPMDSEFMDEITRGLAGRGVRVSRFEFPYMARRREDGKRRGPNGARTLERTWREVVEELGGGAPQRLVIGGKSMGGRIASRLADELGVAGLVCLGYPFHPTGKPARLRTAHLEDIQTPTLILHGTRDPFGKPDEIAGYDLGERVRIHWLEDGDHSFVPRKRSERTLAQNLEEAADVAADFTREALGP